MIPSPSSRETAKTRLRAYFEKTTDIARGGLDTFNPKSCACSMEHVCLVLDGEDIDPSPEDYTVHAIPRPGVGWSDGMARILVAFNDATCDEVLRSDAWRLELLPRFAEATHTPEADQRRLELINTWLNSHGREANITAYLGGLSTCVLYNCFEEQFINPIDKDLLPGALGISDEEYLAFLHTLINP